MVKTSQAGRSLNLAGTSCWRWLRAGSEVGWYTLPDPLMGSQTIVEVHVFRHRPVLLLMQDKHVVQTFPFQTAHEPLANGIGP